MYTCSERACIHVVSGHVYMYVCVNVIHFDSISTIFRTVPTGGNIILAVFNFINQMSLSSNKSQ